MTDFKKFKEELKEGSVKPHIRPNGGKFEVINSAGSVRRTFSDHGAAQAYFERKFGHKHTDSAPPKQEVDIAKRDQHKALMDRYKNTASSHHQMADNIERSGDKRKAENHRLAADQQYRAAEAHEKAYKAHKAGDHDSGDKSKNAFEISDKAEEIRKKALSGDTSSLDKDKTPKDERAKEHDAKGEAHMKASEEHIKAAILANGHGDKESMKKHAAAASNHSAAADDHRKASIAIRDKDESAEEKSKKAGKSSAEADKTSEEVNKSNPASKYEAKKSFADFKADSGKSHMPDKTEGSHRIEHKDEEAANASHSDIEKHLESNGFKKKGSDKKVDKTDSYGDKVEGKLSNYEHEDGRKTTVQTHKETSSSGHVRHVTHISNKGGKDEAATREYKEKRKAMSPAEKREDTAKTNKHHDELLGKTARNGSVDRGDEIQRTHHDSEEAATKHFNEIHKTLKDQGYIPTHHYESGRRSRGIHGGTEVAKSTEFTHPEHGSVHVDMSSYLKGKPQDAKMKDPPGDSHHVAVHKKPYGD